MYNISCNKKNMDGLLIKNWLTFVLKVRKDVLRRKDWEWFAFWLQNLFRFLVCVSVTWDMRGAGSRQPGREEEKHRWLHHNLPKKCSTIPTSHTHPIPIQQIQSTEMKLRLVHSFVSTFCFVLSNFFTFAFLLHLVQRRHERVWVDELLKSITYQMSSMRMMRKYLVSPF